MNFRPKRLSELYGPGQFGLSIEIFPPKTTKGDDTLFRTLDRLTQYGPAFVSCTYGAGGGTRERTIDLCERIQRRYQVTATAHLSCVGATRSDLAELVDQIHRRGIRNIMALRGDPPEGQSVFQPVPGGLAHANELVELIRQRHREMGIGVAGYPEKHKEAPDLQTDLLHLKRKVDAGADAVFTQLFYVNENFFRFRDLCERLGIHVPVVPGLMPVTEYRRIQRITELCGAQFPTDLAARLEAAQNDPTAQFQIGVDFAIEQCRQLMAEGVPGLHFYVLNRSEACERILEALGFPTKDDTSGQPAEASDGRDQSGSPVDLAG